MDANVALIEKVAPATVSLQVQVPAGHPSVWALGTERLGSGTLVDSSGLILTVNYVVLGAEKITVTLSDGRSFPGETVAQDFESGIALLRIPLTIAPLVEMVSSRTLEIGQPVFVVAGTGGEGRKGNGGIVTYLGPFDAHWEYMLDRAIMTTALNPGFGGGGLFTMRGDLVGVVSLNLNELLRSTMVIPVEYFLDYREEFLTLGQRIRSAQGWIGFYAHPLEGGLVVASVVPYGPAQIHGLREGDVILGINSRDVTSRAELYGELWKKKPGDTVVLNILRDKELKNVEIVCGNREEFYR
ncbi:MAG: serine protease [Candidatus Tectomicrobia bacterium]|uniref:Serine protease n=1 Tax=Tectimicrobiota bacterium TaxID=2528274 RepID=A0A932GR41_UNCTE|nr:serine protease [Candidatus Tectomicrobia bacterium]